MKTITIRDLRQRWPEAEAALQVEDEIIVRKYTLANVERIVIDGLTFIVKGTAAYEEWAHPVAA